ncbi:MAG: zinc ribbon domain-containing protein [Acidobacteria bacterium]|jgi:hypothetical protein|nr:zinc ribbon domain-containing protein [Acidobacteriota bacterium]
MSEAGESDTPQLSAIDKYACPACGAQAEWHPGKQLLICTFCGSESPYDVHKTGGTVAELDLLALLRELPEEQRGWDTERRSVQCQSCRAVMVFDPTRVGKNCDFCGSPALVDYEELQSPIRPQSLLPFKVSQTDVREGMKRWYARRWFAPNAFKKKALVDQLSGLYVPYWTFDAQVHCPWQADSGHYYYTTETYRDNKGHTRTRQVRHVRWTPAAGAIDHFFDDEPVPGTEGIDHALLRQIEPFPTQEVVPYDTAFLSGFVVERYQITLEAAAKTSTEQMHSRLEAMCGQQVPGDTHRNLRIQPAYSAQTFKHLLLPVWLLTYTFGKKTFHVAANGVTGEIAGSYPKSFWKIGLLALAVLAVVLILIALQG